MKRSARALIVLIILIVQASAQSPSANRGDIGAKVSIDAQEILERIEKGENIIYQNQRIIGDLNIQQFNLSRDANYRCLVDSAIVFVDCEFQGNIYFNYGVFNKSLNFTDTKFSGEMNLQGSQLNGNASFWNSKFHKAASFDDAVFLKGANFRGAEFSETASFESSEYSLSAFFIGAIFKNDVYFGSSLFEGNVYFEDAQFIKSAIFHDAIFNKEAIFQSVKFLETSDFVNAVFHGDAKFINAEFQKPLDFSNATFIKDASFQMARFDAPTDFSYANFSNQVNFNNAMFNKVIKFSNTTFNGNASFSDAYFEREARFDAAQFGSNLNLNKATFYQLMLPWDVIKDRIGKDKATHLALINNYKSLGWILDRNGCYYQYREMRRNAAKTWNSKIMDTISWAYWGYGVRPFNAIFWIAVIILAFGLLYRELVHRKIGVIKISEGDHATANFDSCISFYEAVRFSALTLASKSPGNIQMDGRSIQFAAKLEKVVGGFFFFIFLKFLTDEFLSYFKPPT